MNIRLIVFVIAVLVLPGGQMSARLHAQVPTIGWIREVKPRFGVVGVLIGARLRLARRNARVAVGIGIGRNQNGW
ncbi:hypothetical protein ACFL3B_04600 [Gemmatimonadota bacterium]